MRRSRIALIVMLSAVVGGCLSADDVSVIDRGARDAGVDGRSRDTMPARDGRRADARAKDGAAPDAWGPCVHPKVVKSCRKDTSGIEWCTIPAGCFVMGSPVTEPCHWPNETEHQVTLTRGFEIMATEVTQGQFLALMGYNPSRFDQCGATCPVDGASWYIAAAFANALSKKAGKVPCYACTGSGTSVSCQEAANYLGSNIYQCPGFRLPTEAEWEYAYRAGTATAYYNGANDPTTCSGPEPKGGNLDQIAWYGANSDVTYKGCQWIDSGGVLHCLGTHPVGRKLSNGWGLVDMSGNVTEWCHDRFGTYQSGKAIDPTGPASGSYRAVRGGSFGVDGSFNRAASRVGWNAEIGEGFRLVRTAP